MRVSLPERTVDAWVVAYLVTRVPDILLWAPTQRHHPDFDVAAGLPGPGKLWIFENKAPYTNGVHGFQIGVRQLYNYLRHPVLRWRTFYVLPCPPWPVADVPLPAAPPPSGTPELLPERAQARLGGHRWHPHTPAHDWFYIVSVVELWSVLVSGAPLPPAGSPWWPNETPAPAVLAADWAADSTLPVRCPLEELDRQTLREFMDGVLACDRPELRTPPERPSDEMPGGSPDDDAPSLPDTAVIAFAPASTLPGWAGPQA